MIVRTRVGQITLAVRSPRAILDRVLPTSLLPFRVGHGEDIRLQLVEKAPGRPRRSDLLFESGGLWNVYRLGWGLLYAFWSPDGKDEFCRALAMDTDRRKGVLFLAPSSWCGKPGFALSYPLEELLFQHHAARAGAAVIHACGVALGARVLLFCGESGAGKTTLARLWRRHRPGATILSDDRVLIRHRRAGPWAYGTPWHGSGGFASPASGRVAAIFFLTQGGRTRMDLLQQPTAAAELFSRTFLPPWEAETVERVLGHCERVTGAVPCFRLAFRPDRSVIEAVEGRC